MVLSIRQTGDTTGDKYVEVSLPAPATAGSLLVFRYACDSDDVTPTADDLPGGSAKWTQQINIIGDGNAVGLGAYTAIAVGGEQTVKILYGNTVQPFAQISEYPQSGTPTLNTAPVESFSVGAVSSLAVSVTATSATVALAATAKDSASGESVVTWSDSFSEIFDDADSIGVAGADKVIVSSGPVNVTATYDGDPDQQVMGIMLWDGITLAGAQHSAASNFNFTEPTLASPAVAGNLLILRTTGDAGTSLVALDDWIDCGGISSNNQAIVKMAYMIATGGETSFRADVSGAFSLFSWVEEIEGWVGTPTLDGRFTTGTSSGANVTSQSTGTIIGAPAGIAFSAHSKDSATTETVTNLTNSFIITKEEAPYNAGVGAYLITAGGNVETTVTWSGPDDQQVGVIAAFEDVGGGPVPELITIDWSTKVISIAKEYLITIQTSPTEIYQLDLDAFRLDLKDIEDGDVGIVNDDTHSHNTEVLLSGITYARVIEIINGYTITFEDGQYAVNLIGANSNVADVVNVNQVSVRAANSAGLIAINTGSGVTEQDKLDIADRVWDEPASEHVTTGTLGDVLNRTKTWVNSLRKLL